MLVTWRQIPAPLPPAFSRTLKDGEPGDEASTSQPCNISHHSLTTVSQVGHSILFPNLSLGGCLVNISMATSSYCCLCSSPIKSPPSDSSLMNAYEMFQVSHFEVTLAHTKLNISFSLLPTSLSTYCFSIHYCIAVPATPLFNWLHKHAAPGSHTP